MTSEARADPQLPETMPGTVEELRAIASQVIGGDARSQRRVDKKRLQHVIARLLYIATTVLADLQQQVRAPSAKELEERLERITRLSQELTEDLCSLPSFSLSLLNMVYHSQKGWDETAKNYGDLGLGSAPAELAASAIHVAARQQVESWRNDNILGRIPPTRPGRQRAFQRLIGDPRVFLADQVAQMIVQEQGVAAVTADVKGPVYEVVARLWTYATGRPEEGANLRQYVRRGVWSAGYLANLAEVEKEIEVEQNRFYIQNANYTDPQATQDFRRRIEILEAKAKHLLVRAHASLWNYEPENGLNFPPA